MIIKQDYGSLGNDVQTQMLIAPVLPKMVSDRAYAVGEQFIVNNVLYKITQAVSAADVPLVVGNNCEVSDSITQQIKNTGWIDCKSSSATGFVQCKRIGDIVALHISVSGISSSYTNIGTLPADMIPVVTKYMPGLVSGGGSGLSTIRIVGSTGTIDVANSSGTTCYADPVFIL